MMKEKQGFTLVEVVAALALAGVLLTVLLTVTTRVNSARAADRRDRIRADGLIGLLRHDLIHARSLESSPNNIIITGYGGLDRRTLEPTHRPARVTYRVLRIDGETGILPVLVREQVDLDNRTNREAFIELVAIGIVSFTIHGEGVGEGAIDLDQRSDAQSEGIGAATLPGSIEASWYWVDAPDTSVEVTIDRI